MAEDDRGREAEERWKERGTDVAMIPRCLTRSETRRNIFGGLVMGQDVGGGDFIVNLCLETNVEETRDVFYFKRGSDRV